MRHLRATLKTQLCAILEMLSPDERERLQALAPGVSHQLDLGDEDITHEIGRLVTMEPQMRSRGSAFVSMPTSSRDEPNFLPESVSAEMFPRPTIEHRKKTTSLS